MTASAKIAPVIGKGGEMAERARSVNWSSTPLGDSSSWPFHFITAFNFCLSSPFPSILWWGSDPIELYNDAFKSLCREGYPDAFGKPAAAGDPALWKAVQSFVQKVITEKETVVAEDIALELNAGDANKLNYFTFTLHPVYAASGAVEGVLATLQETITTQGNGLLYDAEQRLRLATEAAAVATFDWDMQGEEVVYSERLVRMFGFDPAENIPHELFTRVIHPDDHPVYKKAHETAQRTGLLEYEIRLIWPDKSIRWIRANGKILYSEQNKTGRMYGVAIDITEQKEQSALLEKKVAERTRQLLIQNDEIIHQKQLMDSIIDASVDYICAIDLNEDLLLFNKKYEEVTGYKKEVAVGRSIIAIFPSLLTASKNLLENMRKALKGEYVHTEYQYSPPDDKYYENFFIPLRSYSGEVFGAMLLSHDITSRIHTEQKLMKANEELLLSNQRLEQFAYIASHDLQEPLRKIQTFAELMHRSLEKRDDFENYYHKIASAAQRMSALIKDVLAYSKLSDTDVILKEVDLNQVVENVCLDFELLIAEKNAIIKCDKLPAIKGIPLQLNQLFSNLISNSLKFSRRQPLITITSHEATPDELLEYFEILPRKRYVKLVFEDNGIGFDQQYANQIFTIFQRLNDRQSYSGTGIGLALCKKIVENHQGYISAVSAPEKGAKFMILLPL